MKQSILISIDALFDTRFATLSVIDQDYANGIMSDKQRLAAYLERFDDNYVEIGYDTERFRSLYRTRDSRLLTISPLTALTYELKDIVEVLLNAGIDEPHRVDGVELVINTAPYNDIPGDIEAFLILQLQKMIGYPINISVVNLPISFLSPYMLKHSKYVAMYIYDIEEWLVHHYNPMVTLTDDLMMPQFTIVTPMIVTSKEKLKEAVEFESPTGETCDYFEGLAFTFKDLFKYETMDAAVFSVAHPNYVVSKIRNRFT